MHGRRPRRPAAGTRHRPPVQRTRLLVYLVSFRYDTVAGRETKHAVFDLHISAAPCSPGISIRLYAGLTEGIVIERVRLDVAVEFAADPMRQVAIECRFVTGGIVLQAAFAVRPAESTPIGKAARRGRP